MDEFADPAATSAMVVGASAAVRTGAAPSRRVGAQVPVVDGQDHGCCKTPGKTSAPRSLWRSYPSDDGLRVVDGIRECADGGQLSVRTVREASARCRHPSRRE